MRSYRLQLVLALGLSLVAPAILAEPTEPEPKTALERFDVALIESRDLIRNASVKLRNGVQQASSAGAAERPGVTAEPPSPAMQCCNGNLKGLAERYQLLTKELAEVRACYERTSVERSLMDTLTLAEEDLSSLKRASVGFSASKDLHNAEGTVAAMQRSYLHLKESRDGLVECQ